MKILIGSRAIKHWFPDFIREPKDWDYIVYDKSFPKNFSPGADRVEHHINPVFGGYKHEIMLPNDLYTLKMSHAFWNINWDKHVFDIVFLKENGCVLNKELFYKLYAYWNTIHGENKRSDLQMTADEFFDNAMQKLSLSHDEIHEILNPTPIYTKILKDGAEVEVDENKFNLLTFEEKLELVREEIYVMSFERFMDINYKIAYSRMSKKFIMNHAPIWEAIFILENYRILHKPNYNFFKKINDELLGETKTK